MSAPEGIYRRVSVRMWGDCKFASLSPLEPSGQALWLYLLTGPHTSAIPGVFVAGRAAMCEALDWPQEAFDEALKEVIDQGLAVFDAKTRLWWVRQALKHNLPASPNVVRSWRQQWLMLPECDLLNRIAGGLRDVLVGMSSPGSPTPFGEAFDEVTGKGSPKPSPKALSNPSSEPSDKPSPNQEQEQKQEQKEKPVSVASQPRSRAKAGDPKPTMTVIPCPYAEIVALYHEKLPDLPKVKLMRPSRHGALRKFWGWVLSSTKSGGTRRATTAEEALEWLGNYFARAAENDFLMGRGLRGAKHANWRCDLDFLLTDKGMKHVIEKTEAAA